MYRYQYIDDKMTLDPDYLPGDYMRLIQKQKMNAISQEFALRSVGNSRWQHSSGVFISQKWLRTYGPVFFGDDMNNNILSYLGMPQAIAKLMVLSDNSVPGLFHTPQLNVGVYHESSISLTDRLQFT